ncbi:hypothetical protein AVL62_02425 [Serinicoccus chungangensis]|uniref:DUF4282 domain-containing protein n=1 Tax=Serinicoccus chungangensis TaxID=767452 RepID=A0A0W8I602_9MICO|nr:DUF4282 domain-containing protein [Serinicoccus chungangensis]KUG53652.1 hypothetical protein AVL62_02425 [Serinicoccus chungangensis]
MSTQHPSGTPGEPERTSPAGGGLKALFDFNFDTFVTPSIVKIVYVIATVLVALLTIGFAISGLTTMFRGGAGVVLGFLLLLASPIIGLVYLAFVRMSLELYYAVIRLSEDVHHRGRL